MPAAHSAASRVYWGGYDLTRCLTRVTVDRSRDTEDVTTFGKKSKVYHPLNYDATLSAEGLYDTTDDATDEVLEAALSAGAVAVSHYPEGDAAGSRGWAVNAIDTAMAVTSATDDLNRVTAEAQSNVAAERVTSLLPMIVMASGATTPQDNGAPTNGGIVAYFHVFAVPGAPVQIRIQHSDGTTWADLLTSANGVPQFTGPAATRVARLGVTVQKQLRIAGGVAGAATYQCGVCRTPLST